MEGQKAQGDRKANLIFPPCRSDSELPGGCRGLEAPARPQPLLPGLSVTVNLRVCQFANSLMRSSSLSSFLGRRTSPAGIPMASNNTASIAQARKLVEQLKMEANIDRIKVRTARPTRSSRRAQLRDARHLAFDPLQEERMQSATVGEKQ
ncbi:hypothetical protein MC885_015626 [Smutsia gigantea]|nr:hypothetical protein MC885_015626 [Smutsia gigantea]